MSNSNIKPLDLRAFFPYQLSILQSHVSDHVGAFYRQAFGMTRNEWRILAVLAMHIDGDNKAHISAKDICTFTKLAKMPVSRALKQLEAANLVARQQSTSDMRFTHFTLKAKGVARYQAIVPKVRVAEQQILQLLTSEEQAQLKILTEKLLQKMSIELPQTATDKTTNSKTD
ncbi:MarR family transcriptional regulator [Thalassotalea euphylliae]|uniref:MarR family transcriptional regulator n=1 Tax=Thalassotalea euphylliae TaxID=1655234 RepID=A0A3E0TTE7_9GAMM|nr:MarR family transcriptional regulator [Thalassotalea euphylliae]REL27252.1 MarR family transcriptional regulator [Thalassotalea euphylliae]